MSRIREDRIADISSGRAPTNRTRNLILLLVLAIGILSLSRCRETIADARSRNYELTTIGSHGIAIPLPPQQQVPERHKQ